MDGPDKKGAFRSHTTSRASSTTSTTAMQTPNATLFATTMPNAAHNLKFYSAPDGELLSRIPRDELTGRRLKSGGVLSGALHTLGYVRAANFYFLFSLVSRSLLPSLLNSTLPTCASARPAGASTSSLTLAARSPPCRAAPASRAATTAAVARRARWRAASTRAARSPCRRSTATRRRPASSRAASRARSAILATAAATLCTTPRARA